MISDFRFQIGVFFVAFSIFSVDAVAETIPLLKEKAVALPNLALAAKVENYLNSMKSLEADFEQVDPSGAAASGKFYLQRPGKFRWEYLKGQQILIISNGSQIAYYDRKLDEITYIPMQYSIASFLADANIKFAGKVKLLSISEDAKQIRAIVTQNGKEDEGSLALYFAKEPMKLEHIEVVDADKNITTVILKNHKFNAPIAKDLFIFKSPRIYKNVWDKK